MLKRTKSSISDFSPGTLLDNRYRLGQVIGEGGMGVVYEGVHIAIHRRVAIKVLSGDKARDSGAAARFYREAQIAGTLGNDNICEVLDVGSSPDGIPYFVMPLLKGSDFSELITRQSLSVHRVVDIVQQVLAALQATHEAGIVHRDIKPANVFVTQLGDRRDFVKVLDFGISKAAGGAAIGLDTQTGAVLGTPHYMSPEQAAGHADVDRLTDIYSVGVMLYEALTGARPFVGDSYNAVIHSILTALPSAPCALCPGMPIALEAIVMKAMSRLPQQRYSSAQEMRAALLSLPLVAEHAPLTQARSDLERRTSSIPAAARSEEPGLVEATEVGTVASSASLPRPRQRLVLKVVGVVCTALVALVVAAGWTKSSDIPSETFHKALSSKASLARLRVQTSEHQSNLEPKPETVILEKAVTMEPLGQASGQGEPKTSTRSSDARRKPERKRPNSAHPGGNPKTNHAAVRGGPGLTIGDSPLLGNSGAEIDPNYE